MYVQVYRHHVLYTAEQRESGAHLAFKMFAIVTVLYTMTTFASVLNLSFPSISPSLYLKSSVSCQT